MSNSGPGMPFPIPKQPELPDPSDVIRAMEAAGFVIVGRGPHHVRMRKPSAPHDLRSGNITVPLETEFPDFADLMGALLRQLDAYRRDGAAAAEVLAGIERALTPGRGVRHDPGD